MSDSGISGDGYYKERFLAHKTITATIAESLEVNEILERLRVEARKLIPSAMEVCILLLDEDAPSYTRPLQCQLYDKPVNCLSCKRFRPSIQQAVKKQKDIIVTQGEPVIRHDGSKIEVGPEMAVPVFKNDKLLAAVSVVSRPGMQFTEKDHLLINDIAEIVGNSITSAKHHWEVTQEKMRISQVLSHLSAFVPQSVCNWVEEHPDAPNQAKEAREVTVLFADIENYTGLCASFSDLEVNAIIENLFSRFVDPIQRYNGDINETAGDGLMIIFQDYDAKTNAENAVRAAFDLIDQTRRAQRDMEMGSRVPLLQVNLGINSGEALVGMTRFAGSARTRMTYTATGPVTNLAARLAGYAQGGDIIIGESTKKLVERLWPVYDRGLVELKGFRETQRVYSLLKKTA